jgi:ribonuclease Z
MDHFVGFDALLRVCLGRPIRLHLFGPAGILGHVEGKLAGYAWNLVANYRDAFSLMVTEVQTVGLFTRQYRCSTGFSATPISSAPFDGCVHAEPELEVRAEILDHGLPCLAFALQDRFHVNIRREALHAMGLTPGPWLQAFKSAIFRQEDPLLPCTCLPPGSGEVLARMPLGELTERIASISPGQKVVYIADTVWSPDNVARMVALARGADQLFIEAAFLERDRELACTKGHLTAHQAGTIARSAGVRWMKTFHHSPRYSGLADSFSSEARSAFSGETP